MRSEAPLELARRMVERFDFGAAVAEVTPHGQGLINDTFVVTTAQTPPRRYILQRINAHVFPQPGHILKNLRVISRYWLEHVSTDAGELQLPVLIATRDGADGVEDEQKVVWRALSFIEHSRTLPALSSAQQARALGYGLGRFHALLSDLVVDQLSVTLPGFHVAPGYLAQLDAACAQMSCADAEVARCLEFIETRRAAFFTLESAKTQGVLRPRIAHGDPKLNNFLFSDQAEHVISLIDLDTVQPGLIHYDVGDCLRSACNTAGESPSDFSAVRFNWVLGRSMLDGYLAAAGSILTREDRALMFDAICLLPLELGVRFLTDHLNGDRYFRIQWPGQNLHKARVQFALARDIARYADDIRRATE